PRRRLLSPSLLSLRGVPEPGGHERVVCLLDLAELAEIGALPKQQRHRLPIPALPMRPGAAFGVEPARDRPGSEAGLRIGEDPAHDWCPFGVGLELARRRRAGVAVGGGALDVASLPASFCLAEAELLADHRPLELPDEGEVRAHVLGDRAVAVLFG